MIVPAGMPADVAVAVPAGVVMTMTMTMTMVQAASCQSCSKSPTSLQAFKALSAAMAAALCVLLAEHVGMD